MTAAHERYERLIGEIEAARSDLLEMRATEVWVSLFPHDSLHAQPPFTTNLALGRPEAYARSLPGLRGALNAAAVFELLREDARACSSVATADQAAAMYGAREARLSAKRAKWEETKEGREEQRLENERGMRGYISEWGIPPAEYPE